MAGTEAGARRAAEMYRASDVAAKTCRHRGTHTSMTRPAVSEVASRKGMHRRAGKSAR
jgi:hypothetical protein